MPPQNTFSSAAAEFEKLSRRQQRVNSKNGRFPHSATRTGAGEDEERQRKRGPHIIMGQLSFFQAAYVGGGAISRAAAFGGAMSMVARPQQEQQQQRRRRPNVNNTSSKSMSFIYVVALLLCMSAFTAAQDTCNCSPIRYTFVLKLDEHTCPVPPDSVTPDDAFNYFGPGVQQYTCQSLKPRATKITEAQFIPLDSFLNTIPGQTQTERNLELTNGDSLTFTSPATIPPTVGAVLLKLVGVDENGGIVESVWTIQFTNECGVLSLENGTKFGWVIFRDLVRPSQELCPRDIPPYYGSYSYDHKVFSKAGKGKSGKSSSGYAFSKGGKSKGSKHTRHSSSKSGKNLNSKYDGYGDDSSKSGKSKSGKSSKSRRMLQAAISANAERMKEPSVEEGGQSVQGLRLRRRRLHV